MLHVMYEYQHSIMWTFCWTVWTLASVDTLVGKCGNFGNGKVWLVTLDKLNIIDTLNSRNILETMDT